MDLLITSYKFLHNKEKLNLFIIFLLITISSFLEMVGLGLILPLLTAILDSNFFDNNEIVGIIKSQLNITTQSQLIIIIIFTIIFANMSKAIFLTLSAWKQISYMAGINKRFSNQMYLDYVNSNWKFLVNKNSSILLRNIYISTQDYVDKVLQSYLLIAAETIMIIFLLSLLIFITALIYLFNIFDSLSNLFFSNLSEYIRGNQNGISNIQIIQSSTVFVGGSLVLIFTNYASTLKFY